MSILVWLGGLVAAAGVAAVSSLVSDEARGRLEHIPDLLLDTAISRLPEKLRADVGEEWRAELEHILHHDEAYPLTRLLRGIRFASGLLRAAPGIGRELVGTRRAAPAPEPGHRRRGRLRAWAVAALPGLGAPRRAFRPRHVITVLAVGFVGGCLARSWLIGLAVALLVGAVIAVRHLRDPSAVAGSRTRTRLTRLRRAGYTSIHRRSLPGTGEIIDHLVIGPTGIYAVTSQQWDPRFPARVRTADCAIYHGPASQARCLDRARASAAAAAALISEQADMPVDVQAGLAVYGAKLFRDGVPLRGVVRLHGVDVFASWQTRGWLRAQQAVLSASDVERLAAAAAYALPACPARGSDLVRQRTDDTLPSPQV